MPANSHSRGIAETAICIRICIRIGAASNMLVPEYMEYVLMGTVMIVPGCNQKFKARSVSYTENVITVAGHT